MLKTFKKLMGVALALAVSTAITTPAFAKDSGTQTNESSVSTSAENSDVNPLDSEKEILYYLFWTQDTKLEKDRVDMQKSLQLSSGQMANLKAIGLKQFQADNKISNSLKGRIANTKSYNDSVETEANNTNQSIQSMLGDRYPNFRDWIAAWWQGERKYRNSIMAQEKTDNLTSRAAITTHTIYATQYEPNTSGAREVALPDKYIKFANLGWDSHYSNPPYTVTVRSSKSTLTGVRVDDVGPHNKNDNYWDTNRRLWNGQISLGTPEAYAAYVDHFNGGKDEFGRTVTNPAGIDLSTSVARSLGLGSNASGWIVVTFSDLP